jgi:hypothetical protein
VRNIDAFLLDIVGGYLAPGIADMTPALHFEHTDTCVCVVERVLCSFSGAPEPDSDDWVVYKGPPLNKGPGANKPPTGGPRGAPRGALPAF